MVVLLKTTSVRVSSIQIMQVRVQNKGKSVWKSRYDRDVSAARRDISAVAAAAALRRDLPSASAALVLAVWLYVHPKLLLPVMAERLDKKTVFWVMRRGTVK